ncbi:hypothetical protein G6F65_021810 [Rhizopus arrhizus]|nr:hypothetical protein G6F65_021810 [Rhizopus arrhizus]
MALARAALGEQGGVVLLSPGAPSFGAYRDYVARGRHFAELAGFDPDTISAIPGLGIGGELPSAHSRTDSRSLHVHLRHPVPAHLVCAR